MGHNGLRIPFCAQSNLVLLKRVHDMVHNITRSDIRYKNGVMVVYIRWSKTNQHRVKTDTQPVTADNHDDLCPVRWIMYMLDRVPAHPHHNLFSYLDKTGKVLPVTYRDLMMKMREWLRLVGVKDKKAYSSHSLRRGAASSAVHAQLSETAIMELGKWSSNCYRRYIDSNTRTRIENWKKFAKYKH